MPFRKYCRELALGACLFGTATAVHAQSGFNPQGGEYSIAGELPGDQVAAALSLHSSGGYLVWQDSRTDGDGFGISGVRLNSSLTSGFDSFRINAGGAGDQENPDIAALDGGSSIVVWQGGEVTSRRVFARIIQSSGTFQSAEDLQVNVFEGEGAVNPQVAGLDNGDAVVVWGSFGQDDPTNPVEHLRGLRGVYARIVSSDGSFLSAEIPVNETVQYNQRTPAVAGLESGDFVVVWATERVVGFGDSLDTSGLNIMGRVFSGSTGEALTGEFQVNQGTNVCSNPKVVGTPDGGFSVVWSERVRHEFENSWGIALRHFPTASGVSSLSQQTVNVHQYGDQYAPSIEGSGERQLVVWTSLGQDGDFEGVYGRFVTQGQISGDEFQVNTTTASRQIRPIVGAQNNDSMLVVWSSFVGGVGGVDLQAQRYATAIPAPGAPVVSASSSWELFVAWPEMDGFDVQQYLLYVDGAATPVATVDNFYTVGDLDAGSSHTFRLAYVLGSGISSPLSEEVAGTTFGRDQNYDGLPDDWQEAQFGSDQSQWGLPTDDYDGDGVSNRDEFFAGTNPADAESVLRMNILSSPQGWRLLWNSVPGLIYKVQSTTTLGEWGDVGGYRFSVGNEDSAFIEPASDNEYFRVIRIR